MNPSQGNVSLTQSSLGGLSDIIQNVEDSIEENDMKHDMTILENPISNLISASNLVTLLGMTASPKESHWLNLMVIFIITTLILTMKSKKKKKTYIITMIRNTYNHPNKQEGI